MASNSLLLTKNDSNQNLLQNLSQWTFGNFWSLQNMAILLKRLQAQGACAYQSQGAYAYQSQ